MYKPRASTAFLKSLPHYPVWLRQELTKSAWPLLVELGYECLEPLRGDYGGGIDPPQFKLQLNFSAAQVTAAVHLGWAEMISLWPERRLSSPCSPPHAPHDWMPRRCLRQMAKGAASNSSRIAPIVVNDPQRRLMRGESDMFGRGPSCCEGRASWVWAGDPENREPL